MPVELCPFGVVRKRTQATFELLEGDLTYAYYKDKDIIEFIEIYFKGDKENEDRARIREHYRDKK